MGVWNTLIYKAKTSSLGFVTHPTAGQKGPYTAMAPQQNIIQQMFSTVVGHESLVPGNIASTSTYLFATHPNPDLSLALWSAAPDLPPESVFSKLTLPLQTANVSSIVGPNRAIVRFLPNEIAFGYPRWIGKGVLSKVRRDLGLDSKEGPGGETRIELKEILIIGNGGTVAAELRSVWLRGVL